MKRKQAFETVRNLAARIARGWRPSRLQPPMRRKPLFEALEQRFLLSGEGVVVPPPPPPPVAAQPAILEAQLEPGAPATISAASTPVEYALPGAPESGDAGAEAAAAVPAQPDPSGVTDTMPEVVAVDPVLAKVDAVSGEPVATVAPAPAADTPAAAAPSQQAEPLQKISLAAYVERVQNLPAPSQVVVIDAAVPNYEALVRAIANFGITPVATPAAASQDSGSASAPEAAPSSAILPLPGGTIAGAQQSAASTDADAAPEGAQILVTRIGEIEVVILDTRYDGVDQITDVLSPYQGLAAVQVLSHGASGNLRLGSSVLNSGKLEAMKERVGLWGAALRPGGDILLYGCDVAGGPDGLKFIDSLASATGADVAASTNATGASALGGDWKLEHATGGIEAQQWFTDAALAGYADLLTGVRLPVSGTPFGDTLTSAYEDEAFAGLDFNDTYKFIDNWGDDTVTETNTGGVDTLDFSDVTSNLTFTIRADGSIRVTDDTNPTGNLLEATGIESLVAGSGANRFVFQAGALLLGKITSASGGTATLDYSAYATAVTFNLESGAAAGIFGGLAAGTSGITGLTGGSGSDSLTGLALDSRWAITAAGTGKVNGFFSFGGVENLVAGTGENALDYTDYATGVTVNLATNAATGLSSASGFDNVTGTAFADTLTGNAGNNVFSGGTGADTITGGGGTDTVVETRDANFTLTDATLTIGSEVDNLSGILKAKLTGGDGNNVMTAAAFSGSVTLDGKAGNNTLTGSAQNDVLIGGSGIDVLVGGGGDDTLTGGGGIDNIDGGTGTNTLLETGDSRFILTNTALDMGEGTSEVQTLSLGSGVTGGTFTLSYNGSVSEAIAYNAGVDEVKNALAPLGGLGDGEVTVSASAATLTGTVSYTAPKVIAAGTLTIDVGAGAVTLTIAAGTYDAGTGATNIAKVLNNLIGSESKLAGKVVASTDTSGNLVLTSGASGPGAKLTLAGTNKTSMYGAGTATATGGPWVVTFSGNLAGKNVSQLVADSAKLTGGSVTVSTTTAGVTQTNTIANIQIAQLTGGDGDNVMDASVFTTGYVILDGGFGNDTLTGTAAADTLKGGGGNDLLTGGSGNDSIDGGEDLDTIIETRDANMTLSNIALVIGAETDTIGGVEYAALTGGASANTIDASGFSGGMSASSPLSYLNRGAGVNPLTAAGQKDLRITLRDGKTVEVELKGVQSLQDVFDRIHLASDKLTGDLNAARTAIVITDATAGGGNLAIAAINGSTAAAELGISGTGVGATFTGSALIGGGVTLDGAGSADILTGSAGNDILTGGAGADTITGGAGTDTLVETRDANMTLTDSSLVVGAEGTDTLSGVERASLTGGTSANIIDGSAFTQGALILSSGGGTDTLRGGSGDDTFIIDVSSMTAGNKVTVNTGGGTGNLLRIKGLSGTLSASDLSWFQFEGASTAAQVEFDGGSSLNVAQDIIASGLNVKLSATTITMSGHTIDTSSAGNAGSITLSGKYITIDGAAQLIAKSTAGGADGAITISAVNDRPIVTGLGFANIDIMKTDVTIGGTATIKGGNVTIESVADGRHYLKASDFGNSPISEYLAKGFNAAIGVIDNFAVFAAVSVNTARTNVSVGASTRIEAGTLNIRANSAIKIAANPIAKGAGVSVGVGTSDATVTVAGTIITTGDATIRASADNAVDVVADASALKGVAAAVAVNVLNSTVTAQVATTANLTIGRDLFVQADAVDKTRTLARSVAGTDGSVGFAIAVQVGDTAANALLDGTVTAGRNVAVTAKQSAQDLDVNKIFIIPSSAGGISAEAGVGTESKGDLLDDVKGKAVGTVSDKIIEKLKEKFTSSTNKVDDQAQSKPGKFDVAGAVSVGVDVNKTVARIGNGTTAADVQAEGSVNISSTVESRPKFAAGSEATDESKADDDKKGQDPAKFGGSLAVTIGVYTNDATATIGENSRVDAKGGLTIDAQAKNEIDPESLWGYNLVAPFLDKNQDKFGADGSVYKSTQGEFTLSAGDAVDIQGSHTAGGEVGTRYRYIGPDFSQTDLAKEDYSNTGRWEKVGNRTVGIAENFIKNLTAYGADFGLDPDSGAKATAKGQKVAVAGAFALGILTNNATAEIRTNARINQRTTPTPAKAQDVVVTAQTVGDMFSLGGNFEVPSLGLEGGANSKKSWAIDAGEFGGGSSNGKDGKGAVGVGILINDFINNTTAKIADGVLLYADSLNVSASKSGIDVALGASGGKAEGVGFNGAFTVQIITDNTLAQIDNGATVTVGSGAVKDSDGNPLAMAAQVEALNRTIAITGAGAIAVSNETAVGASVAITVVSRNTQAVIGNLFTDTGGTAGNFTVGGDVNLSASNEGFIGTLAVAGSKTAKNPPKTDSAGSGLPSGSGGSGTQTTDPGNIAGGQSAGRSPNSTTAGLQNQSSQSSGAGANTAGAQQGKAGVGVSGAVTVNVVSDNTRAYMRQGGATLLTNSGKLAIESSNATSIGSLAGAVAISVSQDGKEAKGIAGAVGVNIVSGATEAYLDGTASITSSGLAINAKRSGWIVSLTAGVAGATGAKGTAVAGSVAVGVTTYTVDAALRNTTGTVNGDVTVKAEDETNILQIAGAGGFGGKTGVGAAVSFGYISNKARAIVDTVTNFRHTGKLDVSASETGLILSVTGAAGVGTQANATGGAGTISVNLLENTIEAKILNSSTLSGSGEVSVAATDSSFMFSLAGAVGVGKKNGIGAAVGVNDIKNSLKAVVENSTLNANGAVTVRASAKATMVGIAVGVGVTAGSADGFALAGSGGANIIATSVDAHISGNSTVTATGAVTLEASDKSMLVALGGGVAASVSGKTGVGASISYNRISNGVAAYVDSSTINSGSLSLLATSQPLLIAVTAAGGGGKDVGGAGTISINSIANSVDAHISASTVTSSGDVSVIASESATMAVIALAGAGATGGTAVGAALAYNYVGGSISPADPNVITYNDGVVEGTKNATVNGADSATPSNVTAYIENTGVNAGGNVVVRSGFEDPSKLADPGPLAGGVKTVNTATGVNLTKDTISFGSAHSFNTGDEVLYRNGGGSNTSIGGLVADNQTKYYVIKVDANRIKLASSRDNAVNNTAVSLTSIGSGTGHTVVPTAQPVSFDPNAAVGNTITFANAHGLSTGDRVLYHNGGGTSIGGLADDYTTEYYVIRVGANSVKLADSLQNANNGIAINIASGATGTGHQLVLTAPAVTINAQATVGNTITFSGAHGLNTGDAVLYHNGGGTSIGGLVDDYATRYYVIKVGTNTLKLATSRDNAQSNTAIALTATGGSNHSLVLAAAENDFNPAAAMGSLVVFPAPHGFNTGDEVYYQNGGGGSIGGLTANTVKYYVIKTGENSLRLATSKANATAATPTAISFSGLGSGTSHGLIAASGDAPAVGFNPAAGANAINLGVGHGLVTGDAVQYRAGTGTAIGGLTGNSLYYVIQVDERTVRLATTSANAQAGTAITLSSNGTGTSHSLVATAQALDFNAAASAGNVITFGAAHGFSTGDAVVYASGGGGNVGGLVSGTTYYVIALGDNSVRLAATQAAAMAGTGIAFTSAGTGSAHSITSTAAGATARSFDPASATRNAIGFSYAHGINTGDALVYKKGGADNTAVGGLASNTTYYAIRVDAYTVRLATSAANATAGTAIAFTSSGTGADHTLNRVPKPVAFAPGSALGSVISFSSVHGLATGDEVTYSNGGGTSIGGLTSGSTHYYAIKLDDNSIRLATTRANALAGTALGLTSSGSGTGHAINLTAASSRMRAISSAGDAIALTAGHTLNTGDGVVYHNGSGTSVGGLTDDAAYYVIKVDDYAFRLASSSANATAGTSIALTRAGGGSSHSVVPTGTEKSFTANASTVAVHDALEDTIAFTAGAGEKLVVTFGAAHGLNTGDAVTYQNGGGTSVGGLTGGSTYYIIKSDDNTVRLAATRADAVAGTAIAFTSTGSGVAHSLTQTAKAQNFDASGSLGATITFGAAHGFATGDEVLYHNGGGTSITGLKDDGTTKYYVVKVDDNSVRLARSRGDALIGNAIELRSRGAGSAHNLISTAVGATAKNFDPASALASTAGEVITFAANHGLQTGDAVYYKNGGGTSVGGLADDSDTVYFVIKTGDRTIKLADSEAHADDGVAIAFTSAGSGTGHSVVKTAAGSSAISFDPGTSIGNTITFAAAHGYATGDAVVYQRGAVTNGAIGGLTENVTYYVIRVDATSVRLATSAANATAGTAVTFTSAGTGAGQSLVASVSGATALSFASTAVGTAHGLSNGDAVVYHNGGGTSIGGLVDGETYYAVKIDATHVRLAATQADATSAAPKVISLTAAGTGASQTLVKKVTQIGVGGAMMTLPVTLSGQIIAVTAAGAGGKNAGGAGAVTVNLIREGVEARISNATGAKQVIAGGSVSIQANDTSQIASGTGSLALQLGGNGAAVNASVGVSDIRNTVRARIESAKVTASGGTVTVKAEESARIINVVAGGAVSTGSGSAGAFGGSFAVNTIRNAVDASIKRATGAGAAASDVSATGTVTVQAKDSASIATLAGNVSASFGGKAAVGVAFAVNDINNTTTALIDNSAVSSSAGDLLVDASFGKPSVLPAILDWQIASMAVSGSGAQNGAGAGSVALNWIRNSVQAKITNIGDLRPAADDLAAFGKISVTASDNSTIASLAGAIAIAGLGSQGVSGAVGASVAYNYLGGDPANPATTTNNVVRAAIENVTGTIRASQVIVSSSYAGKIYNVTVAGAGSTGQATTFALGGAVSINRIRNTTDAHISGASDLATSGTLADSVKVAAEDNASIWALAGGVGVAVGTQGGAALAAGVSVGVNEITNTVTAYIDDAKVVSAGGVEVSAKSTSSVMALTFGVAVAVSTGSGGFGGSGAGSGSGNTITNTTSASVRNSRTGGKGITAGTGKAVSVTATDNTNIVAVAGSLSFGGAFGAGGGAAGAVGISLAINTITNTTSAYIDNASVNAAGNDIVLTATEQSTITAVTIGGSGAGAGGSGGGGALAGAGAGSGNTIRNKALAYVNNSALTITGAGGGVRLSASDSTTITAVAGGLAVAGAGGAGGGAAGSLGAAAANNDLQNEVKAYIDSSTMSAVGSVELSAQETSVITSVSIGAAVAGAGGSGGGFAGSASGSGSGIKTRNTVSAYIAGSTSASTVSSSAGAVKLTATDATVITSGAGALSVSGAGGAGGGGAVAVGVSASTNDIGNTVSASISNATVTAAAGQNVELSASETSVIAAMTIGGSVAGSGGAGGGASVAAAGAGSKNTVANKTYAYIAGGSTVTTTAGGAVKLTATDASVISAIAGGLGVAGAGGAGGGAAGSMGSAASTNDIQNEVKAYIDSSTVTSAASLEITARETGAISAISIGAAVAGAGGAGGGFAGSAAGSGSGNTVKNTVAAYISGSGGARSVTSSAGAVLISAVDATVISSAAGSLAVAGAGGAGGGAAVAVGGSAASSTVENTVDAYISDSRVFAAAGKNIELSATETSVLTTVTLGGSFGGAGGAGGGVAVLAAGAGSSNTVKNKVRASIVAGSTVTTTSGGGIDGAVKLSATDVSVISAIAGGLAAGGAGGAGGGAAGSMGAAASTNNIENQVKAFIDSSTVTSAGTLELTARETGVVSALSIGAAVAGAGGAGGGFAASGAGSGSGNTVKNTVAAYIGGSTAASTVSSTSGAVKLTAADATVITAVAGSLAIAGAGGAGGGAAVAVGASAATADIANTVSAYIDNASVTAAAGQNVELTATQNSVISTFTIGGSFGGSGGAGGGVTALAAGAGSGSTVKNKTYAYISGASTVSTTSGGAVKLTALDVSVISTIAGGLAAGGAGGAGGGAAGSLGAAAATANIQNEVKAYIDSSTVTSAGDLELTAKETGVIATLSIGAAVAGAGGAGGGFAASGAGSGSSNTVRNTVAAYIGGSTALSNVSTTAGKIKLTASDETYIAAVAGSLAIAGSGGAGGGVAGAIGISSATSTIENNVSAYVDHANVTAASGQNVELTARELAGIYTVTLGGAFAGSGGAGGGVSLAAAGATSINTIGNKTKAYVANGSTVTVSGAGAVKLSAADISTTLAIAGGLAGSGAGGAGGGAAGSLGAAASTNNVTNEVKAYVDASKVQSATGDIELTASSGGYLTAISLGAAVAAAGGAGGGFGGAGAGSGATNTVGTTVSAYIKDSIGTGKGVSTAGGAVKLTASDATVTNAVAGALAFAGAGGAGGGGAVAIGVAVALNTVGNTVSAGISNSSVSAATGNIELRATESASIGATSIGGTLAGAGGAGGGVAASGAGAGSTNTITNTVTTSITAGSTVTTTGGGSVKAIATDSSEIKALAGAFAISLAGGGGGAGAGSLGASVALNTIGNTVKSYVDDSTVTSSGAVELTAIESAVIDALAIGGALAVAGAGGGAGAAAVGSPGTELEFAL